MQHPERGAAGGPGHQGELRPARGLDVEVFAFPALEEAFVNATEDYQRALAGLTSKIESFEKRKVAAVENSAEAKKKAERAALEEKHKNQALLNTYASEKDVDLARERALADVENRTKEVQLKLNDAIKRKKKLDGELEFYKKKPMPLELTEQIKASEGEIKAQQNAIEAKKKEMEQVRVRFDDEKRRYLELIRGGKNAAGSGK